LGWRIVPALPLFLPLQPLLRSLLRSFVHHARLRSSSRHGGPRAWMQLRQQHVHNRWNQRGLWLCEAVRGAVCHHRQAASGRSARRTRAARGPDWLGQDSSAPLCLSRMDLQSGCTINSSSTGTDIGTCGRLNDVNGNFVLSKHMDSSKASAERGRRVAGNQAHNYPLP